MRDPSRVRVSGPLGPYADGFGAELSRVGYSRNSVSLQLQLFAHLSRWLGEEGLDASALTPATASVFLAARRAAGFTSYLSVKALGPLLGYLRGIGVAPPPAEPSLTAAEVMVERYRSYLVCERGLTAETARGYVDRVRPFLAGRAGLQGELDLQGLEASDVLAFVLAQCASRRRGSAKLIVTALRSLLGFLHLEGELARPLAAVVPSVAGWRLAGLPRALDGEQLRRLLASCDRAVTVGRPGFVGGFVRWRTAFGCCLS